MVDRKEVGLNSFSNDKDKMTNGLSLELDFNACV